MFYLQSFLFKRVALNFNKSEQILILRALNGVFSKQFFSFYAKSPTELEGI